MASPGSPQSDRDSVSGSPMLSPRSKLQAMLAAASDDENEARSPAPSRHSSALPTTSDASRPAALFDDDGDDDDIVRPRGRFASRMFESTQNDDGDAESARERARRALNLTGSPNGDAKESSTDADVPALSGDNDDAQPVAPRRLGRRIERQSTPDGTPNNATPKSSPGLFVSPGSQGDREDNEDSSDSDLDADVSRLERRERFQKLVEKKRQERLAREAEERTKKAAAQEAPLVKDLDPFLDDSDDDNISNITDDEAGHRLTQEARPTRKASKKALEEMNRETQRMARNMQLAHQAKTRKKITKNALFKRFNFRPAGDGPEPIQNSSSRPTSPTTDAEMKDAGTPASSPPLEKATLMAPETLDIISSDDEELLSLDQVMASEVKKRKAKADEADIQDNEKGKGKAVAVDDDDIKETPKPVEAPKRRIRVKLPPTTVNVVSIDSDDELTIMETKKSKLDAIFDRVPQKQNTESRSLQAFRAIAHVTSPGKGPRGRRDKKGISAGELQAMLAARAREQAKRERENRLDMLRAKGVVIQTEEERLRQIEQVEDLVARAREEAEEIMQKEREEAKKERREKKKNGEVDAIGWDDSSDDDDYDGDNDEEQELAEIELSGLEDDDEEDECDEDAEDDDQPNPLFENEAEDGESEASDKEEVADAKDKAMDVDDDEEENLPKAKYRRSKKTAIIVSDDEDEVEATPGPKTSFPKSPAVPNTIESPVVPRSVLRSATKNFIPGLPVAGGAPAGLGLTQMFAGTLAGSEDQGSPGGPTMSPMQSLDPFSRPTFMQDDDDDDDAVDGDVVMNSQPVTQTQMDSQGMDLHHTQTQVHELDSLVRDNFASQEPELFELTQDQGLEDHTPLKERFIEAPTSAISTVPQTSMQPTQPASHDSPLVRKGKLRRRLEVINEDKSDSEVDGGQTDEFGFGTSAFGVMKEAAKKEKKRLTKEEFNRKKSKAKEMVEDQAEESEDEYAGLGGADGEESDGDWDKASVKEMIDDEKNENEVEDERKLAALYAERARAEDEKHVDKLFKDITTGMLRRKRGADYDLDDSDDGGEARKRMKRRQFAKMQKALFADERVKKMAENPGNQAFLRTLEDHVSDDEMDIINVDEPDETEESQSQSDVPQGVVPDSQPTPKTQQPKSGAGKHPPAHMRRTKDGKKPSNLGEIRESLSSLLEDPDMAIVPATQYGSESEAEEDPIPSTSRSDKENRSPPPPRNNRRTNEVCDRISLKRANSSSSSVNARHAFTIGSTQSGGFNAPALLRRATSNSFMSSVSASSSGTSTPTDNPKHNSFGDKIKKGATKGSGIIRERDRTGAKQLAGMREKRDQRRMKGAEERLRAVSGLFGGAKFE